MVLDDYEDPSFDNLIDRHETECVKWDFPSLFSCGNSEAIPAWIAEMDFAAPPAVRKALLARATHPVYGYTWKSPDYFNAVASWFSKFGWPIARSWITTAPSIMTAIALSIKTYSRPGDTIITDSPIYPPIYQCIKNLGRNVLFNQLILKNGQYTRNFKNLKKTIPKTAKMYILCNPHNPSGKVWEIEELNELGRFCIDNDLIIASDEVYADLAFERPHRSIASLNQKFMQNSLTLVSPGKTFCMSGLKAANVVIPNKELRNSFVREKEFSHLSLPDPFSLYASKAAYLYSNDWLKRLRRYLLFNRDFAVNYLKENTTSIIPVTTEGSFLLWLDCRGLESQYETLSEHFFHESQLLVSDGVDYGPGGKGFARVHFGFSRKTLLELLEGLVRTSSSDAPAG